MLGAMGWLSFGVVPRATALFVRLERETDKRWGLDGFNVYDKKAIFLFRRLVWVFFPTLRGQY
tara:strand:- start:137 stop:325 length:189 start_codon:yes stop_codon:yes gene_type:complete